MLQRDSRVRRAYSTGKQTVCVYSQAGIFELGSVELQDVLRHLVGYLRRTR